MQVYSDQEHEIQRVRDRIRVRLNLIDLDFRNLHHQIDEIYRKKKARAAAVPMNELDVAHKFESEKEVSDEMSSEDENKKLIKVNRRLMDI